MTLNFDMISFEKMPLINENNKVVLKEEYLMKQKAENYDHNEENQK